jgi:uncharacterized Tic20 family protein
MSEQIPGQDQPGVSPTQPPLTPQEERTWAMLAHLSILVNLVTAVLGVVAVLIIYLVYKDRSRYVAYQSLQSLVWQLIGWVLASTVVGIVWVITGVLSAVIIGLCLLPFAILLSLVPIAAMVYGVIGAVECNQGRDFKYWLIGDWVRSSMQPTH